MEESEVMATPPYVSFVSFVELLDWLRAKGVPAQLDKSAWDKKFSDSLGSQLMSAFRFFKLVDVETPTSELEELVNAEENERKQMVSELLKRSYPTVFAIGLERATTNMLEKAFEELGGSGETQRKAAAFFINACKFTDEPLSSAIRKKARNRRPGSGNKTRGKSSVRAKTQKSNSSKDQVGSEPLSPSPQSLGQNLRTLSLVSGGSLTLNLDVNLFDLSKDDRDFVMALVDRVQEYESKTGKGDDGKEDSIGAED
ncbi:MAG: DUF5343 domain-containing protein [Chloroflexota bacterium]|nr:DUF5343 domain-containing protein [Chloroflexota bacterium]MDE2841654.1 DUF5343 domain-containing protein [Chloroflexota bacterium]MDE2931154.1 DUF5343 domain-containing protein [Chloroflexota bacterium]